MSNTYVMVDVETVGLDPSKCPVVQIGAVAFTLDSLGSSYFRLPVLSPDGAMDNETIAWWEADPARAQQLERIIAIGKSPKEAIARFVNFYTSLLDPNFVAWPLAFDEAMLSAMCRKFLGQTPPWNNKGICMKSLAMGAFGLPLANCSHRGLREAKPEMFEGLSLEMTHDALDDAIWQSQVFKNIAKRIGLK